jgi:hypothetical protein
MRDAPRKCVLCEYRVFKAEVESFHKIYSKTVVESSSQKICNILQGVPLAFEPENVGIISQPKHSAT